MCCVVDCQPTRIQMRSHSVKTWIYIWRITAVWAEAPQRLLPSTSCCLERMVFEGAKQQDTNAQSACWRLHRSRRWWSSKKMLELQRWATELTWSCLFVRSLVNQFLLVCMQHRLAGLAFRLSMKQCLQTFHFLVIKALVLWVLVAIVLTVWDYCAV
jgi:hypothetical protein